MAGHLGMLFKSETLLLQGQRKIKELNVLKFKKKTFLAKNDFKRALACVLALSTYTS